MGEYVPRLVPGLRLRDDLKPLEISPAGGHLVHARRQPAALAEVVAAGRLQPPRGDGPAHGRLRRRRAHAAGRAPALVRRDGRPLPRPDARPLPPHRVRHRRVGPRLHDDLARARLRLPRRDRLPRRGAARHARRAVRDPQRDLHPRGGQRRPLEARRRAGRGRGPARSAGWCSPSTSRSPTTSTSSTGASTRTATSSARCARPGSWSRRTSRPASSRPTARSSTSAPTRRSTSISSSRGSTSTSTARRNTVYATESEALPIGAGQPARPGARAARHAAAHRAGGQAGLRLAHAARLEGRQRARPERARDAGRLQARAGRRDPADVRPGLAGARPRGGDRPHALGDAVRRRTSAGRAASSSSRAARTPATVCQDGPRATARSRTRTSSCGTCSGSTT